MNTESIQAFTAPAPPAKTSAGSSASTTPSAKTPGDEAGRSFGDLFSSMFDLPAAPVAAQAGLGAETVPSEAAIAEDPHDSTALDPMAWLNLATNSQGQQEGIPAAQGAIDMDVVTKPGSQAHRMDAQAGNGTRVALTGEAESGLLPDAAMAASATKGLADVASTAHKPTVVQPDNVVRETLKTAVLQAQATADAIDAKESLAAHKAPLSATTHALAPAGPVLVDPALAELGNGLLKRGSSREPHARSLTSLNVSGVSPWSDAMSAGTSHGASPVYAPGALTPAPEAAMAQKVHYWVTRGVQSAELQLDAFAGGSVDVSIAVKGDQAVVEFRTDQPEARRMLLETMPQLKDLLAGEGLMLSGGFVGGSAQQNSGSSARENARPGAREGVVRVDDAPRAQQGSAARKAGAVDLFV